MKDNFQFYPDEVTILGGGELMIEEFTKSSLRVNCSSAYCYEIDLPSGKLRNVTPRQRVVVTRHLAFSTGAASRYFFYVDTNYNSLKRVDRCLVNVLKDLPCDQITAELCVSELLHNAIKAAKNTRQKHTLQITLLYVPELGHLLIGITDDLGKLNLDNIILNFPEPDGHDPKPHGRGLGIVASLVSQLGYNPSSDGGFKEIFFQIPIRNTVQ